MPLPWIFINSRYLLLLCVLISIPHNVVVAQAPDSRLQVRQAADTSPLMDFQVYEPVSTPTGPDDNYGCVYTKLLMDHVFAFSYGDPFVGKTLYLKNLTIVTKILVRDRELHASSMRL